MAAWQELNNESAKSRTQPTEGHLTHELESMATKHQFDSLSHELHSMSMAERQTVVQQLKNDREQKEQSIPGFPALTFTDDGELQSVNHVAHTAKDGAKQLYDVQYDVHSGNRESKSVDWQNPSNGAVGHTDLQYNAAGKEVSAHQTEMTARGTSINSQFVYNPETGKIQFQQDNFRFVDGANRILNSEFASNGKLQARQKNWFDSLGNREVSDEKFDSQTGKRELLWRSIAFADGTQQNISEQDDSKTGKPISYYQDW